MSYLMLKYLHILFAVIVVGTGFGIAFFQWITFRSNNLEAIRTMTRHVVLADWLFTTPAVLGQFITGLLLMNKLHYGFSSSWFLTVITLFTFVGCCWIPVVVIQYKLKNLTQGETSVLNNGELKYWMRVWTGLGIPAFVAMLIIIWLMVAKPLSIT